MTLGTSQSHAHAHCPVIILNMQHLCTVNYNNLQNVATIFLGLFLVQVVFEGKSPIYENKITFLSLDIFLSSLLKKDSKKNCRNIIKTISALWACLSSSKPHSKNWRFTSRKVKLNLNKHQTVSFWLTFKKHGDDVDLLEADNHSSLHR